jgi:phage tail sheath protein FI
MPTNLSYPGVYIEEISSGVKTIRGGSTSVTVFIGPTGHGFANRPQRVTSLAGFERAFGALSARLETGYAVSQFFLNGGSDAWIVRVARNPTLSQIDRALQSLGSVPHFNLLVLPGMTDPAILASAAALCESRRAFLLVDAPVTGAGESDPVGAMAAVMQGAALPRSRSAAVYFPWLNIADPLRPGTLRLSPPSGTIAGLIARTDNTRGVWKAPAGVDASLVGVQKTACALNEAQTGVLNPLGVNCIRSFPNSGVVCWGARTLVGADSMGSEWKYIPVRRLALYIEESLFQGTKWAVFEPNDEPLWAQLRLNIGAFMHTIFQDGALQGATPRDAYFVKCDVGTTTQADIARGIVNILVGFAPLKPAEFVLIKLQQIAGQTTH